MKHVLKIGNVPNPNEYEELIRMFLSPSEYVLEMGDAPGITADTSDISRVAAGADVSRQFASERVAKDDIKRRLYGELTALTGRTLPWGILTGVKPLKLYTQLVRETGSEETAARSLRELYYVSEEKIQLLTDTGAARRPAAPRPGAVGVYIGIPFCPSRCAYCSFPSNPANEERIKGYLSALTQEIRYVCERMRVRGMFAESVYLGGGTPTTLSAAQLTELIALLRDELPGFTAAELTVEAGRPDTLTPLICETLSRQGVSRICINPQSLNDATLARIGRKHDAAVFAEAFLCAREAGFRVINTDLIAGLPGEDEDDFHATLETVLKFLPENLTVHTLSLKKGSLLKESDGELCYNNTSVASRMISGLSARLATAGYRPYYLYRQKQTMDNLENVGYALPGTECIYNMRIMEERQTIIALGAGGSSKIYFPAENRIERVFNVTDCGQYIERIGEMIERKEKGIFSC